MQSVTAVPLLAACTPFCQSFQFLDSFSLNQQTQCHCRCQHPALYSGDIWRRPVRWEGSWRGGGEKGASRSDNGNKMRTTKRWVGGGCKDYRAEFSRQNVTLGETRDTVQLLVAQLAKELCAVHKTASFCAQLCQWHPIAALNRLCNWCNAIKNLITNTLYVFVLFLVCWRCSSDLFCRRWSPECSQVW